ncbi:hypothetical protein HPB48_012114 [Haemaphysalis longicornis]|uniref:Uncharacterized protein n=1 Tax=Haemaphysalis longicornis TaxID=44386 RepID=A0A9J6GZ36_HAELO|nr:hypothetical protein HPB48_012114 [Haemaphysalis longicornis]
MHIVWWRPLRRHGALDKEHSREVGGCGQRGALVWHGRTLDKEDSVEGPSPEEELNVHLALNQGEDEAARDADGDDDELGPKGTIQAALDCLYVRRPEHARDHHHVESDGPENHPLLL